MYDMIISWLALPLGYIMQFTHMLVSDYGLAISLFTLITKIIILPVGIWVYKNSIKIVKIQPAINRLKAKYYGDAERIGEEQSKMYKEQKYNPFASLFPLAIQIVLLLGVVAVIYHPFSYIFNTPDTVIQDINNTAATVMEIDLESNSVEISAMYAIKNYPEAFAEIAKTEEGALAIKNAQEFDLDFFGYDLSATPSQTISSNWIYILAPIIAGVSSWFLCFIQNQINVLQAEQSKANKWGTMAFSVGLSLYLGFFVPTGIALYWVVSNIIAVLQLLLLNAIINPRKYVDYEELEASRQELAAIEALDGGKKKNIFKRDENAKRERADYKRFFSIANKHLVIYSEKSGFYKYFENITTELLNNTTLTIHYVTNDPDDAIFKKAEENPRIKAYYIGPKKIITFMMKMDADIVLMTTPDLETFYIKRSYVRKDIEYIYTCHGPTSAHMCSREGAFDHFDTMFCAGPHQLNEHKAIEEVYNLPRRKTLVPVGFGVIDNLCKMYDAMEKVEHEKKQILLAPSWQEDNILDYCLDELMEGLLHKGYKVILRPHPEYIKRYPAKMDAIIRKYEGCDGDDFVIEMDFSSNRTIWESDLLITDWSGIAYEFSYATKKPSMFINTPMKVLNPNYKRIPLVPTEISWKDEVGISVDTDKLDTVPDVVAELLSNPKKYEAQITEALNRNIYNLGKSGLAGAKYIYGQIMKRQQEANNK